MNVYIVESFSAPDGVIQGQVDSVWATEAGASQECKRLVEAESKLDSTDSPWDHVYYEISCEEVKDESDGK